MKLYHSPPSPFVRKVMVVLHETGLIERVTLQPVTAAPGGGSPELLAKNPLGKIPALERSDGPALYDSRVICRYLDSLAGTGLYPAEPALWEVLTLEATADGMLDAAVLMVYEARFREAAIRSESWVAAQWAKVSAGLDVLEARWMAHLAGPLSIGQIGVGAALGYLDFRHPDRDWRGSHPALATWFEGFGQRPSMIATAPTNA